MSADIEVRPVSTFEWVRAISSIDFGASASVKGVAGRTIKGVAFRLSYWANPDGTQLLTGPARVAVICEVDYKTAKAVLSVLRKHGLISVVRRGRGPVSDGGVRVGDECRLTLPLDLGGRLHVRSADDIDAAIEAMKDANRRKVTGNSRPRKSDGLRGSTTPVTPPKGPEVTGKMVPGEDELRGNPGASYGVNGSAVPTQYLPEENHQPFSLSDGHSSAPALHNPSNEDRERDESTSSSNPKPHPDATAHEVLTAEGVGHDEAPHLISVIRQQHQVRSPAWWRHVARNRDIVQIIADARTVLDENCPTCKGAAKVIVGHDQWDNEIFQRCPDCTADPDEPDYHLLPRFPANIDQQPRTSQRGSYRATPANRPFGQHTASWERRRQQHSSPAARKASEAFALADQLDAEMGVTRTQTNPLAAW